MSNIISTWLYIDSPDTASYFPSSKGKSSDLKVQSIYWKCVCVFFTLARTHNPSARLVFFTNIGQLPVSEEIDLDGLLDRLAVERYVVSHPFQTPPGYHHQWRNQFYEFSILQFVTSHAAFQPTDRILLLDSDCIISQNLGDLFTSIAKNGCITYQIDYSPTHVINGLSRLDMKSIYTRLLKKIPEEIPHYHGGEIYASTIEMAETFMRDFLSVWPLLLQFHQQDLPRLTEEAHLLSYLYYKNNIAGGVANRFIKRIWTDPSTYRNVTGEDRYLAIMHLPAEKRRGFKKYFDYLKSIGFELRTPDRKPANDRLLKCFRLSDTPLSHAPYHIAKRLLKKFY